MWRRLLVRFLWEQKNGRSVTETPAVRVFVLISYERPHLKRLSHIGKKKAGMRVFRVIPAFVGSPFRDF
jgi:hypothetical protein